MRRQGSPSIRSTVLGKVQGRKSKTSYEMDDLQKESHNLEFTRAERGCEGQDQHHAKCCTAGYLKQATSGSRDTRNCTANPPYLPPTVIRTDKQLEALRLHMQSLNLSAYIVPNTDAHMSEYIAERDKRLSWMTGFTGSAGTGVITLQKAVLFTDSRYWIQAERQMDCNWELQKSVWIDNIGQWIQDEVPAGKRIGLDPYLFSIDNWESYSQVLESHGRILVPIEDNLVDLVWTERPPPPTDTIYQLADNFVGSTWKEKVTNIRNQMEMHSEKPTAVLLSGLEETAWLFNLRGDDIPYTPVFYSYTLLTKTNISLFVNQSRLSAEALQSLTAECPGPLCVRMEEYKQASASLRSYAQQGGVRIWIGTEYANIALYREIPLAKVLEDQFSPVMITKASKNPKEQELMRAAHIRDAVALIQYLVWLEKNVPSGSVTEMSGARYVDQLRSRDPGPLSATGPNSISEKLWGRGTGAGPKLAAQLNKKQFLPVTELQEGLTYPEENVPKLGNQQRIGD
ncbi:Xaa-Pro aminopeptidase 2 [Varanus komodoensis]|nr:Xaa-Pro aminopeptidase 2 [Varanus komodoensis]